MAESEGAVGQLVAKEVTAELLKGVDLAFKSRAVLPGDDVTKEVTRASKRIKVGGGLEESAGIVRAVRAGTLRYSPPGSYWVECGTIKRYAARVEDAVIGLVEDRSSTSYRVGLFGTMTGTLPLLSFQGATKRTKPQLKVGDAVYVRIVAAPNDMEPELSCISVFGPRKGWETGEATFGVLAGGTLIRCTIAQAQGLRNHDHPVFHALDKLEVPFEITIGDNGVVWVKATTPAVTICVANAVQNSLVINATEVGAMVKEVFGRAKKTSTGDNGM